MVLATEEEEEDDDDDVVAEWYGVGLATGSNPTRNCCAPTPTQRAIPPGSVNEYQRKAVE